MMRNGRGEFHCCNNCFGRFLRAILQQRQLAHSLYRQGGGSPYRSRYGASCGKRARRPFATARGIKISSRIEYNCAITPIVAEKTNYIPVERFRNER